MAVEIQLQPIGKGQRTSLWVEPGKALAVDPFSGQIVHFERGTSLSLASLWNSRALPPTMACLRVAEKDLPAWQAIKTAAFLVNCEPDGEKAWAGKIGEGSWQGRRLSQEATITPPMLFESEGRLMAVTASLPRFRPAKGSGPGEIIKFAVAKEADWQARIIRSLRPGQD